MSLTSRILFAVGLALVLLSSCVDAHGWLAYPKPRGQYLAEPKRNDQEYAPATIDPMNSNVVCRNDPVMPKASWLPLTAGQSQSITIEFNALHVGDCFVYLTYDGDKPMEQQKWFKIWEQHECKNNNNYNIPIPSYLPSGDHVIFRWEWYALHVYPTVEYYAQCVDATMAGSSMGSLPYPQVNMPGHLPKFAGQYIGDGAQNTNNYWWPWDNQPMFFTGPKLATLNGQSNPATSAPVATAKPTSAPATSAPVTAAPVTAAPTVKATSAPATAAPATAAPVKATSAPISTAPPATAPTSRPSAPSAPSQSVKLNVLSSSSTWWFATTISGHRAAEVVKVELRDDGCFGDWTKMDNGWGDVWVFTPSQEITFPVTVKASLASGSSLTFTVNRLPATSVDSGSVFP